MILFEAVILMYTLKLIMKNRGEETYGSIHLLLITKTYTPAECNEWKTCCSLFRGLLAK